MGGLKVTWDTTEMELSHNSEGNVDIISIHIKIIVEEGSFLHIGAAPSPLTEKKGAVFQVDRVPVIPGTSFKGALRNQIELLFIDKKAHEELKKIFIPDSDIFKKTDLLKPCIPAARISKAEEELLNNGYRGEIHDKNNRYTGHCEIQVDENGVTLNKDKLGICPVCYFMGATGIMGFLRISNFYSSEGDCLIDQTNIRIDRKTGTTYRGAKVDGEQVKPGTVFTGALEIINKTPQGFEFGQPRRIGSKTLDKWLEKWTEKDAENRKKILIEKILFPAIKNIKLLGGQKSKGSGKVRIEISDQLQDKK